MKKLAVLYTLLAISLLINAKFLFNKLYYVPEDPSKRKSYAELLKIADAVPVDSNSIVFIGDSHIQNLHAEKRFPGSHAVNLGIGGESSDQLLARIPDKWHPKKVFVETGINDLLHRVPSDTCLDNLKKIIQKLTAQVGSSNVFITSLLPCNLNIEGTDVNVYPVIRQVNTRLKEICKTNGVQFLDVFDSFDVDNGLSREFNLGDNLHLNEKGNLKWKEMIGPRVMTEKQP